MTRPATYRERKSQRRRRLYAYACTVLRVEVKAARDMSDSAKFMVESFPTHDFPRWVRSILRSREL